MFKTERTRLYDAGRMAVGLDAPLPWRQSNPSLAYRRSNWRNGNDMFVACEFPSLAGYNIYECEKRGRGSDGPFNHAIRSITKRAAGGKV